MMMMVLYRDCYRDVVTTTSPVLPESPRTGAAAAAGTEVPASGRCWRLDAEQEEKRPQPRLTPAGGCTLGAGRTTAARRSRDPDILQYTQTPASEVRSVLLTLRLKVSS